MVALLYSNSPQVNVCISVSFPCSDPFVRGGFDGWISSRNCESVIQYNGWYSRLADRLSIFIIHVFFSHTFSMENGVLKNKWLNNSCAWLAWQGDFIVTMSYSVSKICRPRGWQNHLLARGILLLVDLCSTSTVVLPSDCTQDYKSEVLDAWIQGTKAGHLHSENSWHQYVVLALKACSTCQVTACGGFYLKHASKLQFVLTGKTSCFSSPKRNRESNSLTRNIHSGNCVLYERAWQLTNIRKAHQLPGAAGFRVGVCCQISCERDGKFVHWSLCWCQTGNSSIHWSLCWCQSLIKADKMVGDAIKCKEIVCFSTILGMSNSAFHP